MTFLRPWFSRRLIAVDPGTRCVKLLLVESAGSGLRVLDCRLVDLQEEGLLAPEEIQAHLVDIVREWGEWPMAVALPAQASFSQVLDLQGAGESGVPKVIEEQTSRLRGLSGSSLVYDAIRLDPAGQWQEPYFVTLAREEDVAQHLQRVTTADQQVGAVCGLANALVRARGFLQPELQDGVLVDFGASMTTVVVLHKTQAVFASSFATGSRTLVESLARSRKVSESAAEAQLRSEDPFTGDACEPAVSESLNRWLTQLRTLLDELRPRHAEWLPAGRPVPVRISGGALGMPGLLSCLQSAPGFAFSRWPELPRRSGVSAGPDFVVALGAAMEALRRHPDRPSLLPPRLHAREKALRQTATLSMACAVFLVLLTLLLSFATWQKLSLLNRKRALIREGEDALIQVEQLEKLTRDRDRAFEQFSPLLDPQERTYDLLRTLRALQRARAQSDFWCVLLADSESYARGTTQLVAGTNLVAATNPPAAAEESPSKLSFVLELCVPPAGEQTARILSEVVVGLRKNPLFSRVDSLPAAQRRALVDSKLIIPDRHFALSVDLADLGWRSLFQTVRWSDAPAGANTNLVRRPGSSFMTRPWRAPVPPTLPPPPTNQSP